MSRNFSKVRSSSSLFFPTEFGDIPLLYSMPIFLLFIAL
jgi:hypothetical protein